jgi:hypothetical protein
VLELGALGTAGRRTRRHDRPETSRGVERSELLARCELQGEPQRLRPASECLLDLLALGFTTRARVVRGHAQALTGHRSVAQGLLADQGIDVGILEQGGERVVPGLWTARFRVVDRP